MRDPSERAFCIFRFADVEVREREFQLLKAGEVVPVEPKAFRVLLYLLHNPGRLIPKDELLDAVWNDVAVSENSLTRSIALLRRLLGDDTREPRYIGTVPTIGYRFLSDVDVSEETDGKTGSDNAAAVAHPGETESVGHPQELRESADTVDKNESRTSKTGFRGRKRSLTVAAILVAAIAGTTWYLHRPLPPLRVTEYTRITHDGKRKELVGTDGSRLYINGDEPRSIAQVAITGGEIAPVPVALSHPLLLDVSPEGSRLLVSSLDSEKWNLSSVQIPEGSLRHLADTTTARSYVPSGAWAPDGRSVAYCVGDKDIYLIRADGTEARKLVSSPGRVNGFSWSPDGSKIRFSSDYALWEVSSDGSGLHQLLTGWRHSSLMCCGHWTADGKFFLFLSRDSLLTSAPYSPEAQLWVLDERRGLLRRPPSRPMQLTSGPTRWGAPIPSRDGKKIFAEGIANRGELVRFDSQSNQFQPYLGGISAEFVSFSKDGQSVAYVSFPDGILWRANRDGSGRVQLSDPPLYPKLPRWSPDGTQILFTDKSPQGNDTTYLVSSEGGGPKCLLPDEKGPQTDATWSPDGHRIIFSTVDYGENNGQGIELRILDIVTHQVSPLPGSERVWSPRWSPDGRYVAGMMFRL